MSAKWTSKFELKPNTWVFVPTEESFQLGKKIKSDLEQWWRPPKNYFHLRAGGHVKALERHLENSVFAHLDIQNFFGSINKSRITRCFKQRLGYSEARRIAEESTVLHPANGKSMLPFGFVQSPILASFCLSQSALGHCLQMLRKKHGVAVSVYVDDIILSSTDKEKIINSLIEVKRYAERSNFLLNIKKEEGPSPQITAFNIKLSHASLAVEEKRMAEFIVSFNETDNESKRRGIHAYLSSVNPTQAAHLNVA